MNDVTEKLAARWKDVANLVLGLWLIASPWVLTFTTQQYPTWNAWIAGGLVALVAIAALASFQLWEEWVTALLGAWLIVSPWVLEFTGQQAVMWNHVAVGVLVTILAIWTVTSESGGLARG